MASRGQLERAVLQVLWDHPDGATAREVVSALPGKELAMTTILTVLDRLRHKELAVRSDDARPHVYLPAIGREDYVAEVMLDALGEAGDRQAALTRFLGGVTDTDTAHLRRALRRRSADR